MSALAVSQVSITRPLGLFPIYGMNGNRLLSQVSFRDPRRGPWYLIGECRLPASSKQLLVGLASGYGTKNGERKARFSEFRIIEGTR